VDEFQLISRYMKPLAAAEPGALGLADDAAVLRLAPGGDLVITTDMLVEGVHFRRDDPPESVGVKALAVNLSDLAAMGAEPRAYVLALALPAAWRGEERSAWLGGFTAGLAQGQQALGIPLAGGDTVATPGPLSIAITALGTAPPAGALRRSEAQCGDEVWVSGTLGDGALGLVILSGSLNLRNTALEADLVDRYRRPRPRLALGRRIAGRAHACADVSDGLIADLGHICNASSVTAVIERDRVPLSAAARAAVELRPDLWSTILSGGDDYELVFTAAAGDAPAIRQAADDSGTPISRIGRIKESTTSGKPSPPVTVLADDGRPFAPDIAGWRYFRDT
jgi:thiamine-monophosphate kinase